MAVACLGLAALGAAGTVVHAQTNEWTWMSGSKTILSSGVYGELGVPATGNVPGTRDGATSWTDPSGRFWLFGGVTIDAVPLQQRSLNDLWEFDPSTNEWTWIKGSSSPSNCDPSGCFLPGMASSLGSFAPGNSPGGRFGAAGWTDSNGNLWLFGGSGFGISGGGRLSDIWEFKPSIGEWAWMGGPATNGFDVNGVPGVYGTLGISAPGNFPGGRTGESTWTDKDGNFWLFGGYGVDSAGSVGYLNDLWRYDPSTNEWAWMGGGNRIPVLSGGNLGQYGTLGVPGAGNIPGGRQNASAWTDRGNKFWLFGGDGYDARGTLSELNDLWQFDLSTDQWTWIGGSNEPVCGTYFCGERGVRGTLGVPASENSPSGRNGASNWLDTDGNFWLFGGQGMDVDGNLGYLNDLWYLNPATLQWTWMGGYVSSSGCMTYMDTITITYCGGYSGVYGQLDVSAIGNLPGSREFASTWTDKSGGLWLFGGLGFDANYFIYGQQNLLGDLWEYQPSISTLPPAVTPEFSIPGGTYTSGGLLAIYNGMANATLYYTTDGTMPTAASTPYHQPFMVASSKIVRAIALAPGYPTSAVSSAIYNFNLWTDPPTFSPPAGTYSSIQTVTISDGIPNSRIYYTTDGTTPGPNSPLYTGPITVSHTETLQASAEADLYAMSTVASATYTINLPPTFTLGASPGSLAISSGGHGTVSLMVTPANGFNSAVSFACSGLPTGASCSFNPATVTPAGSAVTTTLTIGAQTLGMVARNESTPLWPGSALVAAVCLFGWKKRRRVLTLVLVVAALAGLGLVSGCGSGGGSSTTTPPTRTPVTSTVTVTATSGSIQKAAQVTLTVD